MGEHLQMALALPRRVAANNHPRVGDAGKPGMSSGPAVATMRSRCGETGSAGDFMSTAFPEHSDDDNEPLVVALESLKARLLRDALSRMAGGKWFRPFALSVLPDGRVIDYSVSVPPGKETPELIYSVLIKGLSEGAARGQFHAVGLCHDVVLKDGGRNGLRLVLEDINGVAREIIIPYRREANGNVRLDQEQVGAAKAVLFKQGA